MELRQEEEKNKIKIIYPKMESDIQTYWRMLAQTDIVSRQINMTKRTN